jgi:BlaI family transcriptional regulator, penicillinase repressor
MKSVPRISDAEWEVMKVIWPNSPRSAHEVVAALAATKAWSAGTIKTLLNRLHSKGALRFEKVGKSYLYYPAIAEDRFRAAETDSFVDRVFNGALSPMIAHFARSKKLSARDLDGLEQILREERKKQ